MTCDHPVSMRVPLEVEIDFHGLDTTRPVRAILPASWAPIPGKAAHAQWHDVFVCAVCGCLSIDLAGLDELRKTLKARNP